MSAYIKTLKDSDGNITYPQTIVSAVYDPTSGKMLHELLGGNYKIVEIPYTYTTTNAMVVSFTIPDFDSSAMVLDVYINGLHCMPTRDYTLNGNVVSLVNELDAGQTIDFIVRMVSA